MTQGADIAEQLERHLNSPKQTWLLGAGISYPANIPLMYPLTDRVMQMARSDVFAADDDAIRILDFVVGDCAETSHIEHHLTHLGDLISIAERSRTGGVDIGGKRISKEKLEEVHRGLIEQIASTVRWGYRAADKNSEGKIVAEAQVGNENGSIIDISGHRKFVEAVFGTTRAGLDFVRTPVEFFTTNYDRVSRWIYRRRRRVLECWKLREPNRGAGCHLETAWLNRLV
jgi:hypothetical protein